MLTSEAIQRYSSQIILPEIGALDNDKLELSKPSKTQCL